MNPPLPEPAGTIPDEADEYQCHIVFTKAQLLAYRAEVIEMCAAECDRLETGPIDIYASQCADAIRSLK